MRSVGARAKSNLDAKEAQWRLGSCRPKETRLLFGGGYSEDAFSGVRLMSVEEGHQLTRNGARKGAIEFSLTLRSRLRTGGSPVSLSTTLVFARSTLRGDALRATTRS